MAVYGSQYDYVIHVALIATWRISLITSFQPPLLHDYINMLCDDIMHIMVMCH